MPATESVGPEVAPAQTALELTLLVLAALLCLTSGLQYLARQYLQLPFWLWLGGSVGPLLGLAWATRALYRRFPAVLELPAARASYWAWAVFGAGIGLFGGLAIGPSAVRDLAPHFPLSGQIAWGLLWVGLAAPLIEERFFRGTLQGVLVWRTGEGGGVGVAALAFMAVHGGLALPGIWLGLGLVCGLLRAWSGSLAPAVAAHMAWNLGTLALGLAPSLSGLIPWAAGLAALGLLAALHRDMRGGQRSEVPRARLS